MPERKLLYDPTLKDFRCSECGWVRAIPRLRVADFPYEQALEGAFDRHVCDGDPLPRRDRGQSHTN
jgi:hypothetical protein